MEDLGRQTAETSIHVHTSNSGAQTRLMELIKQPTQGVGVGIVTRRCVVFVWIF